jgi:hypothetical protein
MFETPILFLIFNRPNASQLVFEQIRKIQPKQLFIAADGPRIYKEGEVEICRETRKLVCNSIDWDCEVKTLFRDENLGCGKAVSEAINWFFNHVEEGIILEDDCLPDLSFFTFCSHLLSYYKNNEKIMMISGDCFQRGKKRGKGDYYFSAYNHIWGWASWKRAWSKYDFKLDTINNESIECILKRYFLTPTEINYWRSIFDSSKINKFDTWDYQWTFSIWASNGLSILPNVNLVSNIGFGENASHTKNENVLLSKLDTASINFPLRHPKKIEQNKKADKYSSYGIYNLQKKNIKKQIVTILRYVIKRMF